MSLNVDTIFHNGLIIEMMRQCEFPGFTVKNERTADVITVPTFSLLAADTFDSILNHCITPFILIVRYYLGDGCIQRDTFKWRRSVFRRCKNSNVVINVQDIQGHIQCVILRILCPFVCNECKRKRVIQFSVQWKQIFEFNSGW